MWATSETPPSSEPGVSKTTQIRKYHSFCFVSCCQWPRGGGAQSVQDWFLSTLKSRPTGRAKRELPLGRGKAVATILH